MHATFTTLQNLTKPYKLYNNRKTLTHLHKIYNTSQTTFQNKQTYTKFTKLYETIHNFTKLYLIEKILAQALQHSTQFYNIVHNYAKLSKSLQNFTTLFFLTTLNHTLHTLFFFGKLLQNAS